jgi:hypothetical protein
MSNDTDLTNINELDSHALNEASWEFINQYREVLGTAESAQLFNNCKVMLAASIVKYLDKAVVLKRLKIDVVTCPHCKCLFEKVQGTSNVYCTTDCKKKATQVRVKQRKAKERS